MEAMFVYHCRTICSSSLKLTTRAQFKLPVKFSRSDRTRSLPLWGWNIAGVKPRILMHYYRKQINQLFPKSAFWFRCSFKQSVRKNVIVMYMLFKVISLKFKFPRWSGTLPSIPFADSLQWGQSPVDLTFDMADKVSNQNQQSDPIFLSFNLVNLFPHFYQLI